MFTHTTYLFRFAAIAALVALGACGPGGTPAGPLERVSRSVDLDKSEKVRVRLKMPVGEMNIDGHSQKLMDGDFSYNVAEWKPDVRYSSTGSSGELTVEQHGEKVSVGKAQNRWDLRFNDEVPLDLGIEFGAGEGRLNLGTLTLRSVDIQMGAGQLNLDLRGAPTTDYTVRVRGGVGEATVYVPKEIGVSATASGGLGDISVTGLRKIGDRYVNDAFNRHGARIRLDITGGVGSIKLIAM